MVMLLRVMFAASPRRVPFIAAVLLAGVALTGCSPENIPAVTLSESGAPVLVNCGTYFRGVEARDADSGRLVWSASKPDISAGYGVGEVEVGVLPGNDWVETSPLQLEPVPIRWRFVVTGIDPADRMTLEVASDELSTGRAFIFQSGTSKTSEDFRNDTCGYGPPVKAATIVVILIVLAVIAGVVVVGALFQRNRSQRLVRGASTTAAIGGDVASGQPVVLPPAGWYPEPGAPWVLRWWNGAQWTEHRATPPRS